MFGYVGKYGYLCTLIFLLQNCMFLLSIWINWLNLQIGVGNTIIFLIYFDKTLARNLKKVYICSVKNLKKV